MNRLLELGAIPIINENDTIESIADYFGVGKSYLLEPNALSPAPTKEPLSAHEKAMVNAYHKAPDNIQNVVNVALNSYSDEDLPTLAEKEKGADLKDSTAM